MAIEMFFHFRHFIILLIFVVLAALLVINQRHVLSEVFLVPPRYDLSNERCETWLLILCLTNTSKWLGSHVGLTIMR